MERMYDELVKRLRSYDGWALNKTLDEAADAIEALEIRNALYNANLDLANKLAETRKAIIDKMSKPKWIPVTERLPEEKDRYLTVSIEPWFGTTVVDTMRWSGVWLYDGRPTEATVTHWMPLPEPPDVTDINVGNKEE